MNKNIFLIYYFISVLLASAINDVPNYITYRLSPYGRFGDCILAFAKAQWLSLIHDIPLIYRPFPHSSSLGMHKIGFRKYHSELLPHIDVMHNIPLSSFSNRSYLYITALSTKHGALRNLDSIYTLMINNPVFAKKLRQQISPIERIKKLYLPKDRITVALHVRKGSGGDRSLRSRQLYDINTYLHKDIRHFDKSIANVHNLYADEHYPHKFPPDQYYIESLKFLSELLHDQPMYVYLFTDYADPAELVNCYAQKLQKPNIDFAYHDNNTRAHVTSVIDDYWNMAQFDCLIRSASNFSRAVQLLGNHKIIIYLSHAQWYDDAVVVDKIGVTINSNDQHMRYCLPINDIINGKAILTINNDVNKIICIS